MHPDDAAARGLAEGAVCTLSSDVGTVEAVVEITDEIRPGVVSLPHGWGHTGPGLELSVAEDNPGANLNAITGSGGYDVPSGTAVFSGIGVQVTLRPSVVGAGR
jgi:anaerobic selenocysteine-containing dehydrogenase